METPNRKFGEWGRFDRYCKLVLYHEAIDYLREMQRRRDMEISLDELSPADWDKLSVRDDYPCESYIFHSHGYDLRIDNELVAEAFAVLPQQEQSILILHCVMETVAFVGPSGGGKTTLANLISRFFDPQSGMVKIGGVNVKDIPKEELMNTVSFVFQNSRLIKASILENVRMGKPEATREEVLAALHHAQCDDILEKLPQGVDTVIGTKGVYLSGGEQQRIAIARVMLKNAPIIILDEATAFADPDNESRVQAAFSKLSEGKTVIMIAHRLSTVANVDQIFVIQDGRVAECGNSRELLAKDGIFSRMWKNYQTSVQWKVTKEVQ